MGHYTIAVLAGDGIGPEVTAEAVRALEAVGRRFGHRFESRSALVGAAAVAGEGEAISDTTMALCQRSDAILFGAVGGPGTGDPNDRREPMHSLYRLRKELELFANLRPVRPLPELAGDSALKARVLRGVDLMVVRELTGGIYYGKPSEIREGVEDGECATAVDTLAYSEDEIARIVRYAFELARGRRRAVTSVDKANVLSTSRLWRRVAGRVAKDYPDVALRHLLVDACAMTLIRNPREFDVIVTENMFGDILTDEASMLAGSLGMLPSASLGTRRTRYGQFGLYEPIHGTAPDIAGQGKANPLAAILSAAMLLRHSLGLEDEARAVEDAVREVIAAGLRTPDIAGAGKNARIVSTREMGEAVAARVAAERETQTGAGSPARGTRRATARR
jgi:3-isopropylmalate dehydrogenase